MDGRWERLDERFLEAEQECRGDLVVAYRDTGQWVWKRWGRNLCSAVEHSRCNGDSGFFFFFATILGEN